MYINQFNQFDHSLLNYVFVNLTDWLILLYSYYQNSVNKIKLACY
jgi:hypothetical protein